MAASSSDSSGRQQRGHGPCPLTPCPLTLCPLASCSLAPCLVDPCPCGPVSASGAPRCRRLLGGRATCVRDSPSPSSPSSPSSPYAAASSARCLSPCASDSSTSASPRPAFVAPPSAASPQAGRPPSSRKADETARVFCCPAMVACRARPYSPSCSRRRSAREKLRGEAGACVVRATCAEWWVHGTAKRELLRGEAATHGGLQPSGHGP